MGSIVNRRRVMGGNMKLPYDAEIEYLESQGGCTIPTGVVPTGTNITIKTKIYYIGYTTNSQWIFWFTTYVDERHPTYRIIRYSNNNNNILIHNSGVAGGGGSIVNVSPDTLYNIEMYPGYCLINGARVRLNSLVTPVNTSEMLVCGKEFKGRFYSFYMADGDNILLDLIPVRKGGVGYMYDKVSGKLFGNQGMRNFILGPDVK